MSDSNSGASDEKFGLRDWKKGGREGGGGGGKGGGGANHDNLCFQFYEKYEMCQQGLSAGSSSDERKRFTCGWLGRLLYKNSYH